MNEKIKEKLNKTEENIIQLNKFIEETFAFITIIYISISLGIGLFLLIYEFIIGPLYNTLSPQITSLMNQLNLSSSESQIINQTVPIPLNQFIENELILMVPPVILLGLIYYEAKKENHDD